jgi:hypothetical protein
MKRRKMVGGKIGNKGNKWMERERKQVKRERDVIWKSKEHA